MARRWFPACALTATALVVLLAAGCATGTAADAVDAERPGDAGAGAAPAAGAAGVDGPAGLDDAGGGAGSAGGPVEATPDATRLSDAGPTADGSGDPGRYAAATAVVTEVEVWDQPGDPAPTRRLEHPNAEGAPLVFDVVDAADGWLQVRLPVRPNGSVGWIRAADVSVARHAYRIEVRLAERELRVFDGDEVVQLEPIGVGHDPTPTPGGRFYLYELLRPASPDGPYGPYAFGLSGFSEALDSFGGGDGRLGIHGTDDPASIGRDSTNGCIRLANPAVEQLARTVPLGTPVAIVA